MSGVHGPHDHDHHHHDRPAAEGLDLSVPDAALSPSELNRRSLLRSAGLLGAGVAAGSVLGGQGVALAGSSDGSDRREPAGGFRWLAGDHHIHTQYSPDAMYRVSDQVRHASQNGLDWMVITDHGSVAHAKFGVDKVNPDILAAREDYPRTLLFQGLEWNIPAAEHATVFVAPGPNEVAVLKQFENAYDGVVMGATAGTAANEALAISGLSYLSDAVRQGQVSDALMLANHPARRGLDSPHEFRGWRDSAPDIAIGMEGAPGHQALGIAAPNGAASGRGAYDFAPLPDSFPGFPIEYYRTFGGFDAFTATVGGLWDSMLAEGRPWWITANSDSHKVYADWAKNPVNNNANAPWDAAGDTFNNFGRYGDPVYAGGIAFNGDFWPGYYSRTHVGAARFDYGAVMAGMRAGRVWVDHGALIDGLDLRVRPLGSGQPGTTLGGTLRVRKGADVEVVITITLASRPNFAQFLPKLARVDLIAGDVLGPVQDRDSFTTPNTKVVKSFDISAATGSVTLTYTFTDVAAPFYLRVRGTDGNRTAPGLLGAAVDPNGPPIDMVGNADPWADLWFYSNPIFVTAPGPLSPPHGRR
ncbi:PHP domain-containing protein [Frankia sp. Cas3]|uniref:PHP domain-containing protein n=1 Tax=Frankia sp. Cas3 TaxID=3073926 RepID=UPI002AD44B26|nr:PHP domain-containing protein [Frankia sp. Cas3]